LLRKKPGFRRYASTEGENGEKGYIFAGEKESSHHQDRKGEHNRSGVGITTFYQRKRDSQQHKRDPVREGYQGETKEGEPISSAYEKRSGLDCQKLGFDESEQRRRSNGSVAGIVGPEKGSGYDLAGGDRLREEARIQATFSGRRTKKPPSFTSGKKGSRAVGERPYLGKRKDLSYEKKNPSRRNLAAFLKGHPEGEASPCLEGRAILPKKAPLGS